MAPRVCTLVLFIISLFSTGTTATYAGYYDFPRAEATIDNFHCSGSESQLKDCFYGGVGVVYIGSVSRVECQYCKYKQALTVQICSSSCVLPSEHTSATCNGQNLSFILDIIN